MEQLTDATLIINNEVVGIKPNSLSMTEGLGEADSRPQSVGGGRIEQVYSINLETAMSVVKFALRSTVENVALLRSWKTNRNQNVIQVVASNSDGDLSRTVTQALVSNDPEIPFGSDADIEVEMKGNSTI